MRENNRNSIASIGKLPQFTTMNVIDGQAGLVIYSSLIFYSLTIDNILNIILILILAGVSITTLTGENGLINKTISAKEKTDIAGIQEELELAIESLKVEYYESRNEGTIKEYIKNNVDKLKEALGNEDVTIDEDTIIYKGVSFTIDDDGKITIKTGITLDKTSLTIKIVQGGTATQVLTATLTNITGTTEWKSSDETIAKVDNGTITAEKAGEVTITASCNGYDATCKVIVEEISSITTISLSLETATVGEGNTLQITATLNQDAQEDVVWESSDESIATVVPSQTDSKIAIVKGVLYGKTVTITAKNQKGDISKSCQITVTEVILQEGDYVRYNISYTDVYYDSYTYNADNGWRILSKQVNKTDSDLYDIKLISTGIPAGLYYYPNSEFKTNFEYDGTEEKIATPGRWAGNQDQRNAYAKDFYAPSDINNSNMYAAAGLYNNFTNIQLKAKPEDFDSNYYNYGYYKNINGQENKEAPLTGEIFKDSKLGEKITGIRSVMLADLTGENTLTTEYTDKAEGLFKLSNLSKSENAALHKVDTYSYSQGYYWLASPYTSYGSYLYRIKYDGGCDRDDGNNCYGLRPIISITGVQLKNDNGVWRIIE